MSGFPWKVPPSSHAPGPLCTREKWKRASTRHAHKRVWQHYSCRPKDENNREVPRADGCGAAVERSGRGLGSVTSGQMSWSQGAGSVWSHLQEVQTEAESWLQGLREGNGGDH